MRRRGVSATVLIVCLVILGIVAAAGASQAREPADPSSQATGKPGTLALYTWLGALGMSPQRLDNWDLASSDVVMSVEPLLPFTDDEIRQTLGFLDRGGDVVIAVSPRSVDAATPLLHAVGVTISDSGAGSGDARLAQPADSADRVTTVPMGQPVAFTLAPQVVPLLVTGSDAVGVIVKRPSGGRAYILGSPLPLDNDGLRQADSSMLVLTILERSSALEGAPLRIGFDEWHHHGGAATSGVGAIIVSPVGLAGLLGLAAVFAYLAINGRRIGRPIPPGDPGRVPSASQYVRAVAHLHERSRSRGGVADRYAEQVKHRIGRIAGVDVRLADTAFTDALAGYDPAAVDRVRAVLARARQLAAVRPLERDLVGLAQEADAVERAWAGEPPQ